MSTSIPLSVNAETKISETHAKTVAEFHLTDTPATKMEALSLPSLLRWLGGGALLLSGVVFMLQGFDELTLSLRYWGYLAFMGVLTAVGFASQRFFGDAKGARLSFGLALLLVPIQFSQLGGMVYDWLGGSANLPDWFTLSMQSLPTLMGVGVASVMLSMLVSAMAFAVLLRSQRWPLFGLFIFVNSLLLLPFREGVAGFALVIAMLLGFLLLEFRYFKTNRLFTTAEGIALRALLLFPAVIALARLGLHANGSQAEALVGLVATLFTCVLVDRWCLLKPVRETLLLLCAAFGSLFWLVYALSVLWSAEDLLIVAIFLPIAIGLAAVAYLSYYPRFYRGASALMMALLVATTFIAVETGAAIIALCACVLYAAAGIYRNEKAATLVGLLGSACLLLFLLGSVVNVISANWWLVSGGAGIALVVLSSVVERYGKRLVQETRDTWGEQFQW